MSRVERKTESQHVASVRHYQWVAEVRPRPSPTIKNFTRRCRSKKVGDQRVSNGNDRCRPAFDRSQSRDQTLTIDLIGFMFLDLHEKNFTKKEPEPQPEQSSNPFKLTRLTTPSYLAHLKSGNTLSTNGTLLVLQDGSGTIQVRTPPDFQPKKIPWRNGVLRDIVWSSGLNTFLLLTKNALYSLRYHPPEPFQLPAPNLESEFTISAYSKIKPYDEECAFWRCACVQSTLYITYAGRTGRTCRVVSESALLRFSRLRNSDRWVCLESIVVSTNRPVALTENLC